MHVAIFINMMHSFKQIAPFNLNLFIYNKPEEKLKLHNRKTLHNT